MLTALKKRLSGWLDFFRHKKSYAQDGEDVVLLSFLEGRKNYKGFFVDVGAHHPVRFSNTWLLYKKGWCGINIDPTPGSMSAFRWWRKRDINLEIGIGPMVSTLTFYCFNEPALNTFDPKVAEERDTGRPYRVIKKVPVKVEPLSQVLAQYASQGQKIDLLSIDVEGLDLQVLQSNDWERFSPEFIMIEDHAFRLEAPGESAIYRFLKEKEFDMVATLRRTIVYRRRSIT